MPEPIDTEHLLTPRLEQLLGVRGESRNITAEMLQAVAAVEKELSKQEEQYTNSCDERRLEIYNFDPTFGEEVAAQGRALLESGKDVNQVASILADNRSLRKYGLGVMMSGRLAPMSESAIMRRLNIAELLACPDGTYDKNSPETLAMAKNHILEWLRIPRQYWDNFTFAVVGLGGTSAVQHGIQTALQNSKAKKMMAEGMGWPAYAAMAKCQTLDFEWSEDIDFVAPKNTLPIYQFGPHNSTGRVPSRDLMLKRAQTAAKNGQIVVGDMAYTSFSEAHQFKNETNSDPIGLDYHEVMSQNYKRMIGPYLENGVKLMLAIGPTKCFGTFRTRPGGISLMYSPDADKEDTKSFQTAVRACGSAFNNTNNDSLIHAFAHNMNSLIAKHQAALRRLAAAEEQWREMSQGTPLEEFFKPGRFAGLFRNVLANDDADVVTYGNHICPVISQSGSDKRVRINISGLPEFSDVARNDIKVFASVVKE